MFGRGRGRGARHYSPRRVSCQSASHSAEYYDAEAHMVIQTSVEVQFRVHSYFLKASSTYFRHMPDPVHLDDGWGTPSATIHLEAQSEAFTALLDIIIIENDGSNKRSEYTWDTITSVPELGERYGFETLPRLLSPIMHQYAKNHTWEVFRFTAKNGLELLAAYAITEIPNMEGFLVTDHSNINPELFDDIPPRDIVPFMRILALYPSENPFGKVDWKSMAYNFPSIRETAVPKDEKAWTERFSSPPGGW